VQISISTSNVLQRECLAKRMSCKETVLQRECLAKRMSCKENVLQRECLAKRMSCKENVLQRECLAKRIIPNYAKIKAQNTSPAAKLTSKKQNPDIYIFVYE